MKKLLILLLFIGVFVIVAPVRAADGTISGTVTHAADGTPINGISLSAQNITTRTTSYATAAADGTYNFELAPGTYDIVPYTAATSEPNISFMKKSLTVTIASGETKSGNNFALVRRGRFAGRVFATDGVTPLMDAGLTFWNAANYTLGYSSATTLSDGSFLSSPIPNDSSASAIGAYTIYVTKVGYFGASISNVLLTADETTTTTSDIKLTPGSTVSGTVRDANGTAVANATATLTKTGGGTYTAFSNATGAFTIYAYDLTNYNGSAVGEYKLAISKTGYVTRTKPIAINADGSSLPGNDVVLAAAGTISGTLTTGSGGGLAGATVSANDGFGNSYSTTTESTGAYTLSNLPPSTRYTLTVTKTNYVGQKAYNVTVTAGATTSGQNFTLSPGKTFSGTIIAKSNGAAIEGATIYLYKRNKTRSEISDFSFTTKSDGSFTFQSLSPGKYRVKTIKNGYVTLVQDSQNVNSNVTGKVFKLELAGSIYGRVYTSSNTAAPSADIIVYAINNGKEVSYTTTTSDENGYFLVTGLKKGTYRLKIITTEYVTRIVKINVKTGQQSKPNIKLTTAGSVSGYITDRETGLPVAAQVRVLGKAISVFSDANGYYVLDGIPPGTRKLVAVNPYYNTSSQKSVKVSAGKTKAGVNFALTPKQ